MAEGHGIEDLLIDTPFLHRTREKGRQQGMAEGMAEGCAKGREEYSGRLGIPFLRMTDAEWEEELSLTQELDHL